MSRRRLVTIGHLAAGGLAAIVLAAGCAGDEPDALEPVESGTVETVTDGDTLRLTDGRRIRLVQIDAPEERTECYGREATRALIALAPPGTEIELVRDPELDDADGGGRLLRYVEVAGQNVNIRLVDIGAASPYFFRNDRGRSRGGAARHRRRGAARAPWLLGRLPGRRAEPGARLPHGTRVSEATLAPW